LQAIALEARPDAFPLLRTADDLFQQLLTLVREPHDYKTVVIDSVTALERLFVDHVIASDDKNPKSINQALGGYGAGVNAVAAMHGRVRKAAGALNARGMNVILLAHADVQTMSLPDSDDYMRYSLRLPGKSLPPYVDDVDLVGFIRLVQFTKGEEGERKKAISTGARELICHATASNVSKNRFDIETPIKFAKGENPLADTRVPIAGLVRADGKTADAVKGNAAKGKASKHVEPVAEPETATATTAQQTETQTKTNEAE
jgi:hypothetical protein